MKFIAEFVLFVFIMGQIGIFVMRVNDARPAVEPRPVITADSITDGEMKLAELSERDVPALPFDMPHSARPEEINRMKKLAKREADRILATGDTAALEAQIAQHGVLLDMMGF